MNTTFFLYKACFVTVVIVVPFVVAPQAQAQSREVIGEILVHGNFATPTDQILALAGLAVGEPADDARLRAAEAALRDSGRFESVEVRRRFRSIADPTDILVIVLVNERVRGFGLWAPIVAHRDGYGVTYGARVTFDQPLGAGTRLSVPLTWGGERRAAVEVERTFGEPVDPGAPSRPVTVGVTAALVRRENPHYREIDSRRELSVRAEKVLTPWLRASADARYAYGASAFRRTVIAGGGQLTVDTRQDPSFPRNAVHATAGLVRLKPDAPYTMEPDAPNEMGPDAPYNAANIAHTDLRTYIGVAGPVVLALRGQGSFASAPLPRHEQPLAGGSESLRGYRAGHDAGDSLAAISAELRLPITAPLSFARFGVKAFADAAAAWPHGESIRTQQFDRGLGAGIFFGAAILTGGVDIAWPERGKPRLHAALGVTF